MLNINLNGEGYRVENKGFGQWSGVAYVRGGQAEYLGQMVRFDNGNILVADDNGDELRIAGMDNALKHLYDVHNMAVYLGKIASQ